MSEPIGAGRPRASGRRAPRQAAKSLRRRAPTRTANALPQRPDLGIQPFLRQDGRALGGFGLPHRSGRDLHVRTAGQPGQSGGQGTPQRLLRADPLPLGEPVAHPIRLLQVRNELSVPRRASRAGRRTSAAGRVMGVGVPPGERKQCGGGGRQRDLTGVLRRRGSSGGPHRRLSSATAVLMSAITWSSPVMPVEVQALAAEYGMPRRAITLPGRTNRCWPPARLPGTTCDHPRRPRTIGDPPPFPGGGGSGAPGGTV